MVPGENNSNHPSSTDECEDRSDHSDRGLESDSIEYVDFFQTSSTPTASESTSCRRFVISCHSRDQQHAIDERMQHHLNFDLNPRRFLDEWIVWFNRSTMNWQNEWKIVSLIVKNFISMINAILLLSSLTQLNSTNTSRWSRPWLEQQSLNPSAIASSFISLTVSSPNVSSFSSWMWRLFCLNASFVSRRNRPMCNIGLVIHLKSRQWSRFRSMFCRIFCLQ